MNNALRAGVAVGMLAVSCASNAQSSVTLYGIVDVGVDWENNVATAAGQTHASGSAVRMTGLTSSVPSRFGLRGKEDLGGGLKAVFALENSFLPNSGTLANGGRLFGREAWVGLESPYGALRFGRQYTAMYYHILKTDSMGPALYSLASLDSYIPHPRADNSIAYYGTFGPYVISALYSLGRDSAAVKGAAPANGGVSFSPPATNCPGGVPGDTLACRQLSALVGYWTTAVGLHVAYDEMRGGPGTVPGSVSFDPSAPILLSTDADKTVRYMAGGWVQVGPVKITAGAVHRKTSAATTFESNIFNLGASYLFAPDVVFDAEVARIAASQDKNATYYILRSTYLLSKRTAVYAAASFMQNNSNGAYSVGGGYMTVPGAKQVGILTGLRTIF
jgi:predicted porin